MTATSRRDKTGDTGAGSSNFCGAQEEEEAYIRPSGDEVRPGHEADYRLVVSAPGLSSGGNETLWGRRMGG